MISLPQVAPTLSVSNVPDRTLYWCGFDQYHDCATSGDWLTPEEYAAMLPEEKRGYEYAQRCQADTETDSYLGNRNSFGDLTVY